MEIHDDPLQPSYPIDSPTSKQSEVKDKSPSQHKTMDFVLIHDLPAHSTPSERKISAKLLNNPLDTADTDPLLVFMPDSPNAESIVSEEAPKSPIQLTANELDTKIKTIENTINKNETEIENSSELLEYLDAEITEEMESIQADLDSKIIEIESKKEDLNKIILITEKLENTIATQDTEIVIIQKHEIDIQKVKSDLTSEMDASKKFLERLGKETLNLNNEVQDLSDQYEKLESETEQLKLDLEDSELENPESEKESLDVNLELQKEIMNHLSTIAHIMHTKSEDFQAIGTKMQQLELDLGKTYETLQTIHHTLDLVTKQRDTNTQTHTAGIKQITLLEQEIDALENAQRAAESQLKDKLETLQKAQAANALLKTNQEQLLEQLNNLRSQKETL